MPIFESFWYFSFQVKYYMETRMNASGHVIEAKGIIPEMIDWLSRRYQFRSVKP